MQIKEVVYSKDALNLFELEIDNYNKVETGGVLMGYIRNNKIFVEKASNSGTNAIHEIDYFKADSNYVDMFIDIEYANSEGKFRYLGEWHTHSQISPFPSHEDLISLNEISESTNDFCLLLIIATTHFDINKFNKQTLTLFMTKDGKCRYLNSK